MKHLRLVLPAVALALVLGACAAPATGGATLTDDMGREVAIPADVQRVVSLAPSVTESLYAIGAGDLVVGRSSFDNYPPEVVDVQEIGGFVAEDFSVEAIVALEPDIVIGGSDLQAPLADSLEAAGVPFFVFHPATFEDVYRMIDTLGQITGHEDGAQAVVDDMQARLQAVDDVVRDVPEDERPTVFYEVWDEPLITAGPSTFIGQMIIHAGGRDIFADLTDEYPTVSAEVVIERQPQVIFGPQTHAEALTIESITARPGWADLPAVANGQIYLLDDDIVSRNGPRIIDAVETMAAYLYPDLF